ncbi:MULTISPECIES: hypothetical protein [unclassified Bradyrhizobium]|uniref:hypothetical protein n=1 Tax=Bradyrhizobium sp. USDA 4541 TaxID=2817704 RepID=UPI0020A53238|nr:hypothetical protein [Bradyrhizobium sp. USDA 4541]MCP1851963.1 hypothetical protein [Bradyrhizobium sp. USDA 4541]
MVKLLQDVLAPEVVLVDEAMGFCGRPFRAPDQGRELSGSIYGRVGCHHLL